MAGEDLDGLGGAAAGGGDDVEEHVRDDAPVEVEGDAAEEDEGEADVDVDVCEGEAGAEEDGRADEAPGTDEGVHPRVLGLQLGGEHHPQRHPHDAGHHHDHPEDECHAVWLDLAVRLLLGLERVLQQLGPPPGEGARHEGDTGEGQRREHEALVLR